jgi:hypothetical protein
MEQDVDFNYLYHRHQVSLYMAQNAASEEVRAAHRELADRYRARIADGKQAHPGPVAP